jgi:ketosteroid isomerase-like protein
MRASLIAGVLLLAAVALPASGQQTPAGDKDMIKVRQDLADKFAAAIANKKNVTEAVAENYTADAVLQSLCPETPLAFGPDVYAKRVEGALRTSGFRDYSAKVKEAHLLRDDVAWSAQSYTFTTTNKEGKPEQVHGNSIEMLRREGDKWKISFQAYARTPCS